ncbi:DUF2512 family protein [Desmospora activa]|uniref:Uncharacterized protein DUF2512 n=1 Tax=Desmospora activa DSM 45169 TaxID=1121389 RepID=A0A2T4Z4B3_9BACL|nr:DUF2512 family protein [Desmospora activa]PTM56738.1 uncharacterized protein DUF2512 [Desmospora activa DSM 45169]
MWINFGCKAIWAFFVIALFHYGFTDVTIAPFLPLLVAAVSVALVGTWLDYLLLPHRSVMTAALIDLLAFSLLLYGLQYLFSDYSLTNHAALTIGLILALLEWMVHRQIYRQPRYRTQE